MRTVEEISQSDSTVTVVPPKIVTKLSNPTIASEQLSGVDGASTGRVVDKAIGAGVGEGMSPSTQTSTWVGARGWVNNHYISEY